MAECVAHVRSAIGGHGARLRARTAPKCGAILQALVDFIRSVDSRSVRQLDIVAAQDRLE
jgi:hypothetical protein